MASNMMSVGTITNPILKGFNPDPSIAKAGDTYYIAVSTFEWLPGVRVYASKDLAVWEHCTDILTNQVDLRGNPKNCSIWAPQLSYYDGLFYLIYTDVKSTRSPFKDCHNYLITASDMTGPWSEPIYLNSSGFDPSLYHDEDGRKWLLNALWDYRIEEGNKSSGIVIQEYDPVLQTLIGKPQKLFDCTPLKKTEAPHIYKREGYYYLITAEGGTGTGHAVTVARSKELLGSYEVDPLNPMLTSRNNPELPLQCAGHGSLVETANGEWYMAHLCTRPLEGEYAILGRETALQQVYWDEEGWLRLTSPGNTPQLVIPAPQGVAASNTAPDLSFVDEFTGPKLHKVWNTLRILPDESWCSFTERPGTLRIRSGESPQSLFHHHVLGYRQTDTSFRAETTLDFEPDSYLQMAGLMLYRTEESYLYAYISHDEKLGRTIGLMRCQGDEFVTQHTLAVLPAGSVKLQVEVNEVTAQFSFASEGSDQWTKLGEEQSIRFLSGGFTGSFVAIGVHDMHRYQNSFADFHHFQYTSKSKV